MEHMLHDSYDCEQEAVKLVREILKTQGLFDGHATIDQLYIASRYPSAAALPPPLPRRNTSINTTRRTATASLNPNLQSESHSRSSSLEIEGPPSPKKRKLSAQSGRQISLSSKSCLETCKELQLHLTHINHRDPSGYRALQITYYAQFHDASLILQKPRRTEQQLTQEKLDDIRDSPHVSPDSNGHWVDLMMDKFAKAHGIKAISPDPHKMRHATATPKTPETTTRGVCSPKVAVRTLRASIKGPGKDSHASTADRDGLPSLNSNDKTDGMEIYRADMPQAPKSSASPGIDALRLLSLVAEIQQIYAQAPTPR